MAAITLKFLFPNHDDIVLEQNTSMSTTVGEVKDFLISNWPSAANSVEGDLSPERLRLICMGRILNGEGSSLDALKVKQFDHPTPINVSVRPAGVVPANRGGGGGGLESFLSSQQNGNAPPPPIGDPENRQCCVVS